MIVLSGSLGAIGPMRPLGPIGPINLARLPCCRHALAEVRDHSLQFCSCSLILPAGVGETGEPQSRLVPIPGRRAAAAARDTFRS
jgi:hypothetical protein